MSTRKLPRVKMKIMRKKVKRLFCEFQPKHYILDLTPDSQKMTFTGSVIISGQKVQRPNKRLTFHQNGLTVSRAHIIRHDKKGDQTIEVSRINYHKKFDEVRLHTDEMLYPGQYTISLSFKGKITRAMNGMYPCFFKHDNVDKIILATQFESHHAREVFPCIDEPEAKATFQLSLTTPKNDVVLSNTPIDEVQSSKLNAQSSKLKTTVFATTPHMSTYLLAFVAGDIGFKEAKTKQGVAVRVYATLDNVQFTDFALDVAVKSLEFYNDYFGIDYPLDKCDLIALPDFASGAMENWGCVTFREHALFVDPDNTSLSVKQYVALVVAHELAHQWFGNLVTMRWWNDLWLNEGFASWIEYLAVDHIFPKWQVWTQFIVDEQQQALKLDSLEHTHPIEVPVYHPDEIRTIFDAISYSKGASVIHMLHNYLGAEAFKAGLQYYLKKHSYANTNTIDLWDALEEASEKPVKDFMHAWTSQAGYPLLTANINEHKISLSQQRFFTNPGHTKHADKTWPIALLTDDDHAPDLMKSDTETFSTKDVTKFKLNQGQSGLYRVAYNSSHMERLGSLIKKGHLSAIDRLGLLTDLLETAKAGKTDTADMLHFLENFHAEDNYAVWDVIASVIGSLRVAMDDEKLREDMKPFVRALVSAQLKRLGWDVKKDDTHFDRLLRPIILGLAASADEKQIIDKCKKLFSSIHEGKEVKPHLKVTPTSTRLKRGIDIDPDLRGTVYSTAARLGGKAEFDKLFALHNSTSSSEEKVTLSAALSNFEQPELNTRALSLIKTDDVRLQDVIYWIIYSFMNRHAKLQTWQWLKDNWQWLEDNLGTDMSFARMPIYVARSFSDIGFLKEYKAFFNGVMSPTLDRSFKQGIEVIEWQAAWKKRSLPEITTFFANTSRTSQPAHRRS